MSLGDIIKSVRKQHWGTENSNKTGVAVMSLENIVRSVRKQHWGTEMSCKNGWRNNFIRRHYKVNTKTTGNRKFIKNLVNQ